MERHEAIGVIKKIRTILFRWKFYIGRSATYISLVNLGMVLFLTLSKLKEVGYLNYDLGAWFLPLYIVTFILFCAFGWFDVRYLKGYQEEVNRTNDYTPLHPHIEEMRAEIKELKAMLEKKNV